MSPNKKSRRHPLEGQPGFARYLRSEQIIYEADALLAAWKPLTSPDYLDRAERFMNEYAASDDLLSFPWEKNPLLLEDLELATYYTEALKIHTIAMRWVSGAGARILKSESLFIMSGGSRQEKQQRLAQAIRQYSRPEGEVGAMLYLGTKTWLEAVEPVMALRRARIKQALTEENRVRDVRPIRGMEDGVERD